MGSRGAGRCSRAASCTGTNRTACRASGLTGPGRGVAWCDIAAVFQVLAGTMGVPGAAAGRGPAWSQRPSAGRPQERRGDDRGTSARAAAQEQARVAILEAVAELLLEKGLTAVSTDAVAARAEVSKATVYRWQPAKPTLALDALLHEGAGVPAPRHRIAARRPARPPALLGPARQQAALRSGDRRAGHRGPDQPRVRPGVPRAVRRAAPRPGTHDLPPRHPTRRDPGRHQSQSRARSPLRPGLPPAPARSCPLNDRIVRDVIDTTWAAPRHQRLRRPPCRPGELFRSHPAAAANPDGAHHGHRRPQCPANSPRIAADPAHAR